MKIKNIIICMIGFIIMVSLVMIIIEIPSTLMRFHTSNNINNVRVISATVEEQ